MVEARRLVGTHDVLFVTLDTLRHDVAADLYAAGRTPRLAAVLPAVIDQTPIIAFIGWNRFCFFIEMITVAAAPLLSVKQTSCTGSPSSLSNSRPVAPLVACPVTASALAIASGERATFMSGVLAPARSSRSSVSDVMRRLISRQ